MSARPTLTDDERYPSIPAHQRALLDRLRQHTAAPVYNMICGDRLTAAGLEKVQAFERSLARPSWGANAIPAWVTAFSRNALTNVPLYRRCGGDADDFTSLPTIQRSDIAREPWSLVPDDVPLDDLIVYYTAGASGSPMDVLSHPACASKRLPLLRAALAEIGATLEGGAGRVSIVFVCSQKKTLTYASLMSFLDGAAQVKVNLNTTDWRHPDDRILFLDENEPEVYTGDPLSLLELAELPIRTRPKALISSAMKLLPAARRKLEERFGCPVIDIYSLCESGPIAVSTGSDFHVLPPDLYVEVVNREGKACSPGERGEITLTGGRNPFLPLLRYRTGDHARIEHRSDGVWLMNLEGRAPVIFRAIDGKTINNLDVTAALRRFALSRFAVHQHADGSLRVRLPSLDQVEDVGDALRSLFGDGQKIAFEMIDSDEWKVTNYSVES